MGHEKMTDFQFEDETIKDLALDLRVPEIFDIQVLLKV